MTLAPLQWRTQQLLRGVHQLRNFSTALSSLERDNLSAEGPQSVTKQMNLCTAVNDALHTAMDTDSKCAAAPASSFRLLCRSGAPKI
jgi:hypothetical protein